MYKVQELDALLIIDMPSEISKDDGPALDIETKTWLLSPKLIHVLNFKGVHILDQRSYKALISYNKSLRTVKKHLYCIGMSDAISKQIQADGLDSVLVAADSLDAIRKKHFPQRTSIDVGIINPFISAAQNVLETQANITTKPGRPYLKIGEDPFPIEIAGLISLSSGAGFKGSVAICFQASTFLNIYSNMVGETATEISPEIQDGVGELINIIYGQAKTELNKNGHNLGLALPTILVGEKLKIRHQSRDVSIILPFESAVGPFFVEVLIEKN